MEQLVIPGSRRRSVTSAGPDIAAEKSKLKPSKESINQSVINIIPNLIMLLPHLIILDVSGRKFRTQKATLHTSPYF